MSGGCQDSCHLNRNQAASFKACNPVVRSFAGLSLKILRS
jgi:hypothetical protein